MQPILEKIMQTLPSELVAVKTEIDTWLRQAFVHHLKSYDFVTREEFDIQVSVLHRMRAQCLALESQLASLAQKLDLGSKTD